ncbi:MAG: Conserved putative secreted protein [Thermoleophilia bacterium]|nr:Conserved putative secreted protein [Thermoleophilia bacterium]
MQSTADGGCVQSRARPEHTLLQARTIANVAALVAGACVLAIAPLTAFGEDAPADARVDAATAQALEVRAAVNELNQDAREDAPAAVGNTCGATLDVEGIGDTCVTPDGLLRVEQANGRSATIHGFDAPPLAADGFAAGSQSAVNGAGASSVSCVDPSAPHYVLVYARPSGVTSRYSTVAPKLRTELYKVSAFLDAESRAIDPQAAKRIPVRCEGGAPTVLQAAVSLSSSGSSFQQIVDALMAQGYEFNGSGTNNERYIVYYDAPAPSGAAGTGHVFAADDSGTATNSNNKGGLYAVEYRYDGGNSVPHWEVLIHEIVHTMGGVVNTAPSSSGAGHCNDGQDIMCYADGGSASSYTGATCATKVLDCNRNDYFNPAPAAGSYLASHWNVAASYNRFLLHVSATDVAPPTDVPGLGVVGASNAAIGIGWQTASDDRGIAAYVVSVRETGGTWRDVATTTRTTATIGGLVANTSYEVGVTARDTTGNLGNRVTIAASTNDSADLVAPAAPSGLAATTSAAKVTFTWNDAPDNVGVADFELRELTPSTANPTARTPRSKGTTAATTFSLPTAGLKAGVAYQYEVVARDAAGNVSTGARVTVRMSRDAARPTAPLARVSGRTASTITLTWSASRDNVGVTRYVVYRKVGRTWKALVTMPSSKRTLRIVKLRRGTALTLRVVAKDAAGNASTPSRTVVARTR